MASAIQFRNSAVANRSCSLGEPASASPTAHTSVVEGEFHFMADKFHLMTEPTTGVGSGIK